MHGGGPYLNFDGMKCIFRYVYCHEFKYSFEFFSFPYFYQLTARFSVPLAAACHCCFLSKNSAVSPTWQSMVAKVAGFTVQ
jgi:hypothetical protein